MIAVADSVGVQTSRIRHEYLEMPGLTLTVPQAARLFGLSIPGAATALFVLEQEGFLHSSTDPQGSMLFSRPGSR